jgi:hypothetical protein
VDGAVDLVDFLAQIVEGRVGVGHGYEKAAD